MDRTEMRADAERHLRALVGSDTATLYDDQWAAIEALAADRRRALVVQRTGWGKSAVYFVATALLRAQGSGPTVIISPLLALMRNQIEAADRAGIRAVTINSTNIEQWQEAHAQIAAGEVDVLLVSPERLNNPGFRDEVLPRLTESAGLLVIDEAHCISDWGHDFRPDYRRIRQMLTDLPAGIPVLATTATANARVTADVAEQLAASDADPHLVSTSSTSEAAPKAASEAASGGEVGAGVESEVLVLRGELDRESLSLAVLNLKRPEERLAWLADHLDELDGSGIIYTLTVAASQEIAGFLRDRGHDVAAYSGQTEPTERQALEQDLLAGRLKALVATSALGMGFDATLGFVVNVGAPASPVAYYQQVGRAGRGTAHATVLLLPAYEDRDIWKYFASLAFPPEQHVRTALSALAQHGGAMSTATLETFVDLSRGRLEMMLKVLDVDGAVRRVQGGWTATGQDWVYEQDRYDRVAAARRDEQALMLEYISTDRCRMRFLREALDDPGAVDCGRCDNCAGLALPSSVSDAAVEVAGDRLSRPGVAVQPRKMWPTALGNLGIDLKGKISAGAEEGRVVARLTDLGLGQALRDLFRPGAEDQPIPAALAQGVIATLSDWQPGAEGIVSFESRTHPLLVASLVEGISRVGKIPVLGRIAIRDDSVGTGYGSTNSAQRIAAVTRRYALDAEGVAGKRVLLVDDLIGTGWSMALGAHWLREAGAEAVLPLALGSET
ncbi:DEAD/DEAH box helicase [Nocardioides marmoriginsengisoli]|uniref:DNA 3'-5' helicase n=1 Tax=Nocardioides marmoriginsengisoli TaxID=661483 RepID=A0A3N0CFJ6_9ACTN|nr:DEAD/DEAH box helicase [Nocardioides marmoriginsengisoli]RNL62001.1 DEAD/DEAH box helicase [Nocardioides marmoriginsengisoli]